MHESEFIKQIVSIVAAVFPAVIFAAIGRMMYYTQKRIVPTLRETFAEVIVILFMGVASGSLGSILGLEDGIVLWGFIATSSYYMPLILKVIFPRLIEKLMGRLSNEISPLCNFDHEKEKEKNGE